MLQRCGQIRLFELRQGALHRCGFDAYQVADAKAAESEAHALPAFPAVAVLMARLLCSLRGRQHRAASALTVEPSVEVASAHAA